ncbi:MAG TPA: sigma-70 family RNA polymerase sigma factor [Lacipirellulaceae bacterium]|nr:sigma-70 family RNA polymerase sigma factor [Lacipirellulaceae bacterium]
MGNGTEHIETPELIDRAVDGDSRAWECLMAEHRDRLRRIVALRLDLRLQGRVDPSDIIQESFIDAARRLPQYAKNPPMPFFIWLRRLAGQRLIEQHRRHLGAQARDVSREVSLYNGGFPEATTADLAANLLGEFTSPSQAVIRVEQRKRLQEALDSLEPIDREILVLRHFEQLSNGEACEVLNLDKSTASKRYIRAMERLKDLLIAMPGGREDLVS